MLKPEEVALFAAAREKLYSAAIGDVLDSMDLHRNFLPARIRPLTPDMVVVGKAAPVVVSDGIGTGDRPAGKLFEALDSLSEGDVYITNGGSSEYALWGELLSTRATHLKAAGAVMNGHHRDTAGILSVGFPTFSWGAWAQDIRYRGVVVDWNVPIEVGGIPVRPGDIVFGDRDGVLVVPARLAEAVFRLALEKVETENKVRDAFRRGMPAVEAWDTYRVM